MLRDRLMINRVQADCPAAGGRKEFSCQRHTMRKKSERKINRPSRPGPEEAGLFSKDPAIRAAAQGTDYYPWEGIREGQDEYPKQ